MEIKPEKLYLELMKRTLTFILWPEPAVPIETFASGLNPVNRFLISTIAKLLKTRKLKLVKERNMPLEARIEGLVWPLYADTMIGLKRLDNLQFCIETVINENIEGDLIETGVWRGGACIFMRAVLAAYGIKNRKVFVADSFEGLPKPDVRKYALDKGDRHYINKYLVVSEEEVRNNFKKYGLLDDQVFFLKGWFKDTLPSAPIEKISILRLDGDMYGSTYDALNNLYPKLSKGGFCIIDDYCFNSCQQAVDDYRKKHKIDTEMHRICESSQYWRKES
jgi:O-methyltransferase